MPRFLLSTLVLLLPFRLAASALDEFPSLEPEAPVPDAQAPTAVDDGQDAPVEQAAGKDEERGAVRVYILQPVGLEDEDIDPGHAIRNLMTRLQQSPVKFRVQRDPVPLSLRKLAACVKGYCPPVIYWHGTDAFELDARQVAILREHLDGGGLLLADCGGAAWGRSFRALIDELWEGTELEAIGADDMLWQLPYAFDEPLMIRQPHDGHCVMGVRRQGRWAIVYHPGNWRRALRDDAVRLHKETRQAAFRFGYNLLYYGYTSYQEATRHLRQE